MFEVVSSVALRVVLSVALRLYGMLLWGLFCGCFKVVLRVVMSVVLRLFERCLRLYRVLL